MGFKRGQKSEKKKPEQWEAGDDVRQLAESIIGESHPHLADAQILYLMRYPSWKKGGKTVGGQALLATPQHRALTGNKALAFIITLNSEEWERANALHQRALLDHELCHCEYDCTKSEEDGESPWKLVGHDVEEFGDVIERHGLWTDDLRLFADEVGRQLELGLGAAAPKKRAGAMRTAAAARDVVSKARDRLIDTGTRDGGTLTVGMVGGEQTTFTAEDGDAARERLAMDPPVGGVQ